MNKIPTRELIWILFGLSLFGYFISPGPTLFFTVAVYIAMCIYGYRTKRDLTAVSYFLTFCVLGLIIEIIANFFFMSRGFNYAISSAGVIIFAGLSACDMQRTRKQRDGKKQAPKGDNTDEAFSAIDLHLDFANLFGSLSTVLKNRK